MFSKGDSPFCLNIDMLSAGNVIAMLHSYCPWQKSTARCKVIFMVNLIIGQVNTRYKACRSLSKTVLIWVFYLSFCDCTNISKIVCINCRLDIVLIYILKYYRVYLQHHTNLRKTMIRSKNLSFSKRGNKYCQGWFLTSAQPMRDVVTE